MPNRLLFVSSLDGPLIEKGIGLGLNFESKALQFSCLLERKITGNRNAADPALLQYFDDNLSLPNRPVMPASALHNIFGIREDLIHLGLVTCPRKLQIRNDDSGVFPPL